METQRQAAENFALRAYRHLKGNRAYALTSDSKNVLAILGRALVEKRKAENLDDMDGKSPSAMKQMVDLLEKLNDVGVNLLQRRSSTQKPPPRPWTSPLDGQPLPPPTTPDERSILAKHEPELLRWFDELGKHPYKAVTERKAAEAHAKAVDAIEYGPDQHNPTLNPFVPDERGQTNLTAKSNFEKSVSPELLDFYRWEAQPVKLDLFGPTADMTLRGRLSKDPDVWAIMELGQSIDAQWRYDDLQAAKQQRAAADATLHKLGEHAA